MTHASLFSGIGGFDLAAELMGWDNIFHCEWNPFGQQVLKHHFPNSKSYNDITKTDFSIHRGEIDILTGGFPCQPYSTAGKRLGKEDERHLFPEMLRTIQEVQPTWVVGENVLGIVNWGGDWYSTKCKLTWKIRGTKYKRIYFQLVPKTHLIEGTGLGLLPTPNATRIEIPSQEEVDKRKEKYGGKTRGMYLTHYITMGLLPTPTTRSESREATILDGKIINKSHTTGTRYGITLTQLAKAKMLPTPNSFDWNTARSQETLEKAKERHKEKGVVLQNSLRQMAGQGFQLNPQFVEEMMGFPENWTLNPFLIGEKNQSKPMETQ